MFLTKTPFFPCFNTLYNLFIFFADDKLVANFCGQDFFSVQKSHGMNDIYIIQIEIETRNLHFCRSILVDNCPYQLENRSEMLLLLLRNLAVIKLKFGQNVMQK